MIPTSSASSTKNPPVPAVPPRLAAEVLTRTESVPTDSVTPDEAFNETVVPLTMLVASAARMEPPDEASIVTVLVVDVTSSTVTSFVAAEMTTAASAWICDDTSMVTASEPVSVIVPAPAVVTLPLTVNTLLPVVSIVIAPLVEERVAPLFSANPAPELTSTVPEPWAVKAPVAVAPVVVAVVTVIPALSCEVVRPASVASPPSSVIGSVKSAVSVATAPVPSTRPIVIPLKPSLSCSSSASLRLKSPAAPPSPIEPATVVGCRTRAPVPEIDPVMVASAAEIDTEPAPTDTALPASFWI